MAIEGEGTVETGGESTPSEEKEFDLSSAIDDIAEGMDLEVPGREDEAEGKPAEGEKPPVEGKAPIAAEGQPAGVAPPATPAAPPTGAVPPPETWSAPAKAQWAALPPEIQAEVTKREGEMMAGLQSYAPRARVGDAFAQIVAPFAETYN